MKRVGKPVFFVVAILMVVFLVLSLTGISTTYGDRTDVYIKGGNDIRWGIDIRGGVDVTFTPPEDVKATETQKANNLPLLLLLYRFRFSLARFLRKHD